MVGVYGAGGCHWPRRGTWRYSRWAVYAGAMFDERPDIQERLDVEIVAWMTTVNPEGQPQSSPVWFLARDEDIVVYSLTGTPRTRNIAANPRISLHLNSTPSGGQLVIIEGRAEIIPDPVSAEDDEAYVTKYQAEMEVLGMTPASFSADYPVRIHIRPTRLRAS